MNDTIKIRPAEGGVDVATDVVDEVHFPIYKAAVGDDGEAKLVSSVNPLPVSSFRTEILLKNILIQMEKLNFQLSLLTEIEIGNSEVK